MNSYYRIRLNRVPSALEDSVTHHCFAFSCLGLAEALAYVQKDLVYDPTIRHLKYKDLDVYFEAVPEPRFFDGLLELDSQMSWQIVEEEKKDWLEEWKKGFKPFRLVGPYWVVPSWEEVPAEAEKPLQIDPGMAFGTGTHATTQLAAAFVYRFFQNRKEGVESTAENSELLSKKYKVIDVGTGTAILALLARLCGAQEVMGIDIDPEACRVARENLARNINVNAVTISDSLLEEVQGKFDLVIANIIDGVLLNIKKDLLRVLAPGGHLIVTGVLEEREGLFLDEFMKDTNLKIQRRLVKEEWVGYWMVQNS